MFYVNARVFFASLIRLSDYLNLNRIEFIIEYISLSSLSIQVFVNDIVLIRGLKKKLLLIVPVFVPSEPEANWLFYINNFYS